MAVAPPPERPLVRLRPRTMAELLDEPFALLRARPGTLLAVVAVVVLPIQLLLAVAQRSVFGPGLAEVLEDPTAVDTTTGDANGLLLWVGVLASSIALPFVAGAFAHLVVAWHDGRPAGAGDALRAVGRRWWALLASWVLVHLLQAIALISLVGPVLIMGFFLVTAPAIVVEGLGPLAGMRRSWTLCLRRYPLALGVGVLSGLVATLLGQALGFLPTLVGVLVGDQLGWVLASATSVLTAMVTTLGVTGATVLAYVDLRVRTEGLDLSLAAEDR